MRFVERADRAPHKCAVFPTLGAAHPKGYYDAGHILAGWDPHVYISGEAVEQMALKHGMPTREAYDGLAHALEQAEREIALLKEQLAEADEELGAVHILKRGGYTTQKKPGRPAKAA